MKISLIIMSVIFVIITSIIVLTLLFINPFSTGQVIIENNITNYTYTKAICDNNNFCQDHIIICNGPELVSITPISGAFAQFKPDFIDPRGENEINTLCK